MKKLKEIVNKVFTIFAVIGVLIICFIALILYSIQSLLGDRINYSRQLEEYP